MNSIVKPLILTIITAAMTACGSSDSPYTEGAGSSTNIISAANFGVTSSELNPEVIEFQAGSVSPGDLTGTTTDIEATWSPVTADITVTAADNEGALVSTGTVYFTTQYGVLSESSCTLQNGRCSVTWESIADLSVLYLAGGQTDIINEIVAWTYGAEGFVDLDGDKRLSDNEFFFDTDTPYLDRNDNGIYDAAIDDTILPSAYEGQNGTYEGPNCDASRGDCGSTSRIPVYAAVSLRLNFDSSSVTAFNVVIDTPTDGISSSFGTNINFTATATDPEDGDVTNVVWESDLDGVIGTTSNDINVNNLSIGTHTITARATDSDTNTTTDTITVTITNLPTATITSPADGSTITVGTVVNFVVNATDTEDGTITGTDAPVAGNDIVWNSSSEGNFGANSNNINFDTTGWAAAPTAHTITVTVTDSDGNIVTDTITLNVNP